MEVHKVYFFIYMEVNAIDSRKEMSLGSIKREYQ